MLGKSKPTIENYLKPIVKPLSGINPNFLTIIGSIPPLLFFVLIVHGYYNFALIIFPFIAIDLLDGSVARLTGKVTPFGSFLDSTIDRISDFLIISAFGFATIVRWEIVVLFLFAAFLVSYVRSRAELAGDKTISFDIGVIERPERLIGVFIGFIIYILAPSFMFGGFNILELIFILLLVLSLMTAIQRVFWAYKKL